MRRILALLIVGAILALTTSTGLASTPGVDGSVTQKFSVSDDGSYLIAVNGTPHEVPLDVYLTVNVGDTVHFDGANWTIAGH